MHLPDGWRRTVLGEVATVQTGLSIGPRELTDPVAAPYLRVANVQDGYFDLSEIKQVVVDRAMIERYSLRPGDVLLTEGGDSDKLGRGHIWRGEVPGCLHQNHIFAVRTHNGTLRPEYLSALCSSDFGRRYFRDCSKQSTNLASINKTQLEDMPIPLPPPDVQDDILAALRPIGRTVELLDRLIGAKGRLRDGLAQALLTGRRRLPAFAGRAWREVRIGEHLTESREPGSHGGSARKLTVRLYGKGVIPKQNGKGGSAKTRYYTRRAGQLIYSKLDFLNGAFGVVPPELDGWESTLDLPAFDIDDAIDARFLLRLCVLPSFYRSKIGLARGGRKARRVPPEDFLSIKVKVPARDEQAAIADILDAATREIDALTRLREAVAKQKRGLMQQLLTGRLRVPEVRDA